MATIAQQLEELVKQKNQLVANLNEMGVEASETETLNSLVPKVLETRGNIWDNEIVLVFSTPADVTAAKFKGSNVEINKLTPSIISVKNAIGIVDKAFYNNTDIINVTIPSHLYSTGDLAFYGCDHLQSVTIKEGVKTIGVQCFQYSDDLTNIVIPTSVTWIRSDAFWGCKALYNIYYTGTSAQWNAITKDGSWNYGLPSNYAVTYNYTE